MALRAIQSFILTCSILIYISTNAQLSLDRFLSSAQDDASLKMLEEQNNYLKGKPYRLSILNKLEVRAQNNELQAPRERYGLRITPSNPWELRSNNNYFKAFQETLSSEKEIAFKEALLERYLLAIDYLYLLEFKNLREKDKSLMKDQLYVLEKQQYSKSFDVDDFIDLQLEQMSRDADLAEIQYELTNQVNKIFTVSNTTKVVNLDWNVQNIISVPRIEKIMDSLISLDVPSVMLAYQDNKIELAQREYNLEKSNINLGFIQTQYSNGRTDRNRNPWGLSAGINIPLTNPNKGDMTKRHLEIIEAKNDKSVVEVDLQSDKSKEVVKLKDLIKRYSEMEQKISSLNAGSLSNTLNLIKANNPVAGIKFNSNILKLRLILLKLQQNIFTSYIELLSLHDVIQQRPLVNFLSINLSTLTE